MDKAFWQGIEEFNQEEFYACHDTLEALWMEANEPERSFYQGILQIAVGCYHLNNSNVRGAIILLGEGSRRLRHYEEDYGGINLTALRESSQKLLESLQNNPEITSGARQHFPKIQRIDHQC
jgi:predicted metal-dependent hydrolase